MRTRTRHLLQLSLALGMACLLAAGLSAQGQDSK